MTKKWVKEKRKAAKKIELKSRRRQKKGKTKVKKNY